MLHHKQKSIPPGRSPGTDAAVTSQTHVTPTKRGRNNDTVVLKVTKNNAEIKFIKGILASLITHSHFNVFTNNNTAS